MMTALPWFRRLALVKDIRPGTESADVSGYFQ
jgi:hypothetical protein